MVKRWLTRLLVCLLVAVLVSGLTLLVAWQNWRKVYTHTEKHHEARATLTTLATALAEYHAQHTRYPEKLSALPIVQEKRIATNDGEPIDSWQRPFRYTLTDGKYELRSYGGDARPGGVGQYADLIAGQPDDWPEQPTFAEFVQLPAAAPQRGISLFAGLVAFPLFLFQAYPRKEKLARWKVVLNIVAIAGCAIFAAAFMVTLQTMPGGH